MDNVNESQVNAHKSRTLEQFAAILRAAPVERCVSLQNLVEYDTENKQIAGVISDVHLLRPKSMAM